MKALILNSGLGHRMGDLTKLHPKCMTRIMGDETILSRQLRMLVKAGVSDVIITTGYYDQILIDYCGTLDFPLSIAFVKNPIYDKTNYIYSIYCAREGLEDTDVVLMHGDLVFSEKVLDAVMENRCSCMTVSSTLPLPEKDFKAVVMDSMIKKVGIEFFGNALAAQPLYKLLWPDWNVWLDGIRLFCENGNVGVYAENAFNAVSDRCKIYPLDVKDALCNEIDTPDDLENVRGRLQANG